MKSTPVAICLEPYGGIFHEQRILRLQDAYFGHCTDVVRSSIATQSPCSMKSLVLAHSLSHSFLACLLGALTTRGGVGGLFFRRPTNLVEVGSTQFFQPNFLQHLSNLLKIPAKDTDIRALDGIS